MPSNNAKRIAEIEAELHQDAQAISKRYKGAPVAVILAGSASANVPRTVTVFSNLGEGREGRMRDQLGILQASVQIEALEHLLGRRLKQYSVAIQRVANAVKKIADETGVSIDL